MKLDLSLNLDKILRFKDKDKRNKKFNYKYKLIKRKLKKKILHPSLSLIRLQFTFKNFISVNAHLGYEMQRWNPQLKYYLLGSRNGMHILNMQSTTLIFRRVFSLLTLIIKLRKTILFISENKYIDHVLKKVVLNSGHFICCNRWIGGVISNYKFILKYIFFLLRRKDPFNILSKKKLKLQVIFDGIKYMKQLPILTIVLNGVKSKWAINEIRNFNILCAAIIDSNASITNLPYSIPGNVHGFAAQIFYIKIFDNAIDNSLLGEKRTFFQLKNKLKLKQQYKKYLLFNEIKKDPRIYKEYFLLKKELKIKKL